MIYQINKLIYESSISFLYLYRNIFWFYRKLVLDKASMFQDSSMAIEAFLQHLGKAENTKQLIMIKSVVDLIDYEFEPTLLQIATFTDLHTLKLPGKAQYFDTPYHVGTYLAIFKNCLTTSPSKFFYWFQ